jgi:hypothetical protein
MSPDYFSSTDRFFGFFRANTGFLGPSMAPLFSQPHIFDPKSWICSRVTVGKFGTFGIWGKIGPPLTYVCPPWFAYSQTPYLRKGVRIREFRIFPKSCEFQEAKGGRWSPARCSGALNSRISTANLGLRCANSCELPIAQIDGQVHAQ